MKLTGIINDYSEYTLYRVKLKKNIIYHFRDSVGLNLDIRNKISENKNIKKEINHYNMKENPNKEYVIMSGEKFLSKYKKLLNLENEVNEQNKWKIEIKNYNLNFKNNLDLKRNNNIIDLKELDIENQVNNIKKDKEENTILK